MRTDEAAATPRGALPAEIESSIVHAMNRIQLAIGRFDVGAGTGRSEDYRRILSDLRIEWGLALSTEFHPDRTADLAACLERDTSLEGGEELYAHPCVWADLARHGVKGEEGDWLTLTLSDGREILVWPEPSLEPDELSLRGERSQAWTYLAPAQYNEGRARVYEQLRRKGVTEEQAKETSSDVVSMPKTRTPRSGGRGR